MKRTLVTALAVALTATFGAFAQQTTKTPGVVQGETIYVKPAPSYQYRGFAVTEKDGALLNEAVRALSSMPDQTGTLVVIVANNGKLNVTGLANNAQQAMIIEQKLKALNGGTKVTTFIDFWNSGGSSE